MLASKPQQSNMIHKLNNPNAQPSLQAPKASVVTGTFSSEKEPLLNKMHAPVEKNFDSEEFMLLFDKHKGALDFKEEVLPKFRNPSGYYTVSKDDAATFAKEHPTSVTAKVLTLMGIRWSDLHDMFLSIYEKESFFTLGGDPIERRLRNSPGERLMLQDIQNSFCEQERNSFGFFRSIEDFENTHITQAFKTYTKLFLSTIQDVSHIKCIDINQVLETLQNNLLIDENFNSFIVASDFDESISSNHIHGMCSSMENWFKNYEYCYVDGKLCKYNSLNSTQKAKILYEKMLEDRRNNTKKNEGWPLPTPKGGVEKWKNAIKQTQEKGGLFAIVTYSDYPEVIKLYLKYEVELSDEQLAKIVIVYGSNKKLHGKNKHIEALFQYCHEKNILAINRRPSFERVLFLDDDKKNEEAAKKIQWGAEVKEYKTILIPLPQGNEQIVPDALMEEKVFQEVNLFVASMTSYLLTPQ